MKRGLDQGYGDPPPSRPDTLGQENDGASTKPILIDLDGDGLELAVNDGFGFDFDDDGYLEKTVWWAAPDDGFLVIDLMADGTFGPGDGVIDQAKEISFSLHSTQNYTDLQALAEARDSNNIRIFDSNGDKKLTAQDSKWQQLKVFKDSNFNGKNDPGELLPLSHYGITEISLVYDNGESYSSVDDDFGARGFSISGSSYYKKGGHFFWGGIGDVALAYDKLGFKTADTAGGTNFIFENGEINFHRELNGSGTTSVLLANENASGASGDARNNILGHVRQDGVISRMA